MPDWVVGRKANVIEGGYGTKFRYYNVQIAWDIEIVLAGDEMCLK
jgi:hypothetical protein